MSDDKVKRDEWLVTVDSLADTKLPELPISKESIEACLYDRPVGLGGAPHDTQSALKFETR